MIIDMIQEQVKKFGVLYLDYHHQTAQYAHNFKRDTNYLLGEVL